MRILRALRRFNTVAFSVMVVLAIALLLMVLWQWRRERETYQDVVAAGKPDRLLLDPSAHTVRVGDRLLAYYLWSKLAEEAKYDVRFVDMHNGAVFPLSPDSGQAIYDFSVLQPNEDKDKPAVAYVALLKTGDDKASGRPLFDAVVGRLADMRQFVIARNVRLMDAASVLDEHTLSMILWDQKVGGEFYLFDLAAGRTVARRPVGIGIPESPPEAAMAAAPQIKFN